MRKAIVTLCIGHEDLGRVTHPRMIAYAKKVGADFVVIDKREYPKHNICYEKYQMGKMLSTYKRIIYFDTDVVVRSMAPNLFEFVPRGYWGGFNEGIEHRWSEARLRDQFAPFELPPHWDWSKMYYLNAGVMVFDRTHKALFENPPLIDKPYWDQPWWSYKLQVLKRKVRFLPMKLNCFFPLRKDRVHKAFIVHCAHFKTPQATKVEWAKKVESRWGGE